jgi:hypothetical protein
LTKSRYGVRTEFADPKVAKRFRQAILQVLARISQQHQDLVVNKGGLKSGQRFGRDSFGNRSKSQEISVGAGKVLQYDTDPRRSALKSSSWRTAPWRSLRDIPLEYQFLVR